MGVYVFGMEMPHSCNECRFSVNGFCRASSKLAVGAAMSNRERTNYCPLAYVPPHGDLIDRGALEKAVFDGRYPKVFLHDCPIIIPADPAEEGK